MEVESCKNYKFIKGNILSSDFINYILINEKIDTIIHFAAQNHVGKYKYYKLINEKKDNSFGNSFQFSENNIMGTHVLLESSRVNIKKINNKYFRFTVE